jgi:hypothetical protein
MTLTLDTLMGGCGWRTISHAVINDQLRCVGAAQIGFEGRVGDLAIGQRGAASWWNGQCPGISNRIAIRIG